MRRGLLGNARGIDGVPPLEVGEFAPPGQVLDGIGADGREHDVAGLTLSGGQGADEVFVQQRPYPVHDRRAVRAVRVVRAVRAAHGRGGLQGEAAGEDGQPAEERPLVLGQQVDAPVDGRAQGALAGWPIVRSLGEQRQRLCQPCRQRLRRHERDARRGQLDCQRQAIEARADLGHRARVRGGEREAGHLSLGALHEEGHRGRARDLGQVGEALWAGEGQDLQREAPLAAQAPYIDYSHSRRPHVVALAA